MASARRFGSSGHRRCTGGNLLALAYPDVPYARDPTDAPGPGDARPDYAPVLQQALQQHSSGDVATAIRTALSIPESAAEGPKAISLLEQIRRDAAAQTAIERRVAESAGKSREAAFTEAAAKQQEAEKLSAHSDTAQVVSLLTDASRLYRQAAMTGLSRPNCCRLPGGLQANRIPRAIDYAIQALSLAPRDVSILDFLRQIRAQSERQTQAAANSTRAGATAQNLPPSRPRPRSRTRRAARPRPKTRNRLLRPWRGRAMGTSRPLRT